MALVEPVANCNTRFRWLLFPFFFSRYNDRLRYLPLIDCYRAIFWLLMN